MTGDFVAEIEAVQAYYSEGRPLAEKLVWHYQRLEEVRADFRQAEQAFIAWETKYSGRNDSPIHCLLEALQQSVDYVRPSFDRWIGR